LSVDYTPPGHADRECEHGWFDAWDWVVDRILALAGSPSIVTGPGEIAFDPHIHTLFSHCSISQPERLIRRAAGLGLKAIGVMDHNEVRGARDATRCVEALKERGEIPGDFLIIPGIEVNTDIGQIGGLFIDEVLPIGLSPAETVDLIHQAGGLAVAIHPYHSTGIGDVLFDLPMDAVEVYCGAVFSKIASARNLELASDPRLSGLAKLGSSDAHYVRGVGCCYSIAKIDGPLTLESLRASLENRATAGHGSRAYDRTRGLLGWAPMLR
jgi:hypothetical protein